MMDNFPLHWRFDDPAFNQLDEDELAAFVIPSISELSTVWSHFVGEGVSHLLQRPNETVCIVDQFSVDWNDEGSGKVQLQQKLSTNLTGEVLVMWSPTVGVRVPAALLLRYWTDFFYPDDDNTIVVTTSETEFLTYCEETFFVERLRCQQA